MTVTEIPTGSTMKVAVSTLLDAGVSRREWKPILAALGYFKKHKHKNSACTVIYMTLRAIRKERGNDLLGLPDRKRKAINRKRKASISGSGEGRQEQSTTLNAVVNRPSKRMAVIVDEVHEIVQRYRAKKGLPPWDFSRRGSVGRTWDERCFCYYWMEPSKRLTVIGAQIHCVDCRMPWGDDRVLELRAKTARPKRNDYIMPKHLAASAGSFS